MNNTIAILGDMFEWADGNPDNEDRAGWTVSLDHNGKIQQAKKNQKIIGAVAGSDDSVGLVVNTWMNEWHAKHLRDWSGRLQHEPQELITWVRDGRREMHEVDRLPPDLEIPKDAERWTHWPESGQRLERPCLNPRFNDGTQGPFPYKGRLHRQEWAVVVVLGQCVVLDGNQLDPHWIKIKNTPGPNANQSAGIWLIR